MRVIGITTQRCAPEGRTFFGLLEPYLEALASRGLAYALIPPQPPEALNRLLPHLDGLLLPGGPDVDPALFGEEPHPGLGEVDPDRDQSELYLARYTAERRLPTLGICRGTQVMNVALGGSLYQDLQAAGFSLQHAQKSPPPGGPWDMGCASRGIVPYATSFLKPSG